MDSELDDFESNLFASLRSSSSKSPKTSKPVEPKKLFDINDDDLLDLLSDGESEEDGSSPSNKPLLTSSINKAVAQTDSEAAPGDHKPSHDITSSTAGLPEVPPATYIPTINPSTKARPILKTLNNSSSADGGGRKKSVVRFMDQTTNDDTLNTQERTMGDTEDKNTADSSLLSSGTPVSSVLPVSSIPVSNVPASSVPASSVPPVSSIPVSSVPASNVPPVSSIPVSSVPVSSVPVSNVPLSSVPVSSVPVSNIPLSNNHDYLSPLSTSPPQYVPSVASTSSKAKSSSTKALDPIPANKTSSISSTGSNKDEEDKLDDSLQFGSYIPSSNPIGRKPLGRRKSAFLNSTPPTFVERKDSTISRKDSSNDLELDKELPKLGDQSDISIPATPISERTVTPASSLPSHMSPPSVLTIQQDSIGSTGLVDSSPITTLTVSRPLSTTPVISSYNPIHSTPYPPVESLGDSMTQVSQLEKQLNEYKSNLNKTAEERHQDLVKLQSAQGKVDALEKERQMLSKLLEETKEELVKEKQLRKEDSQAMESQLGAMRHEIEMSHKTQEERLKRELSDVIERHQEEMKRVREDHEHSLTYWKELLGAEQRGRKDDIDRLRDGQQKLLESVNSLDGSNTTSFNRILAELSERIQSSVKQISDLYSSTTSTQTLQQHTATEVLFDKLATKQKEHLMALMRQIEDYLKQDRTVLTKIETSLLSERMALEEERAKMISQVQQEKDSLQKQKERFFSEQQAWLSDSYTEKHHMMRIQTITNETFTRNQKLEAELNCLKLSLDKDKGELSLEQSKLSKERQELEQEKIKLGQDRQSLLILEQNLTNQAMQVNKATQLAQQVHLEGQQAMIVASEIQNTNNKRMAELQRLENSISIQAVEQNKQQLAGFTDVDVSTSLPENAQQSDGIARSAGHHDLSTMLSQLQHNQSIRDTVSLLKKDDERLEEETEFLHLIRTTRKSSILD